jgi:hypothetical protein
MKRVFLFRANLQPQAHRFIKRVCLQVDEKKQKNNGPLMNIEVLESQKMAVITNKLLCGGHMTDFLK